MPDVHDSKTRSYNMSIIKGKDTRPEHFVVPKTRTKWWLSKINSTAQRDKENKI